MKKEVANYINFLGGTTAYSGKSRIMYINDPKQDESIQSIEECVLNKFGFDLKFKLQTNA